MSKPGFRAFGDDLAPWFILEVEGITLERDITDYIESVEYESAADMADMLRIVVANPGHKVDSALDKLSPPDWIAHKAFQPGNEASLYIGYGQGDKGTESFVGRAQLIKHLPDFPRSGMPTLEIKGYDRSHNMMTAEGPIKGGRLPVLKVKKPKGGADNQGQVFPQTKHSDVVDAIAQMHGFNADIDDTDKSENITIKKGMKHYELVKGLANINNREFWVDFDIKKKKWVLHWKKTAPKQDTKYTFVYGDGDKSTLLSFQPEYGIRDQISTASILIFDAKNQRWISALEAVEVEGEDPFLRKGGGLARRQTQVPRPRAFKNKHSIGAQHSRQRAASDARNGANILQTALSNAGAFRVSAGGVSIDVLPTSERFKTVEEAALYLNRWFLARQNNFIIGHGTLVGTETLRARQVHKFRGLSSRLDGDYLFIKARHKMGTEGIYETEFTAHRVIEE